MGAQCVCEGCSTLNIKLHADHVSLIFGKKSLGDLKAVQKLGGLEIIRGHEETLKSQWHVSVAVVRIVVLSTLKTQEED